MRRLDNLRLITFTTLLGCNFGHLIWTIWLSLEQAKTGWGFGTNIELGALFPWIWELVCIPSLVLGVIYILVTIRKLEERKRLLIASSAWVVLFLQIFLTNLFIFM